jgi:hypothetical protein
MLPTIDTIAPTVSSSAAHAAGELARCLGQGRSRPGEPGQRAECHDLHRGVDGGHDHDHGEHREGHVAPRALVLARGRRRVLEACIGEEQQQRRLAEDARPGRLLDATTARPLDEEEPDHHEEEERQHLRDHQEDRGPRALPTPMTFTHVSSASVAVMIAARGQPAAAAGQRTRVASAKPFDSEATEAMRASQVIQPTSKPTKLPNASRV